MPTPIKIMLIAGEDSGDSHAADLVRALERELGDFETEFFGAAGKKMREAGVTALVESDEFGIVGVPEVVRAAPMFLSVMNKLTKAAEEQSPDVVVLVDFPEFNLKIAKRLKKRGFKVVYYISPQLWAWRSYRVRGISKYVDLLLTILPFENDWYRSRGVAHTRFVGNPLTGKVMPSTERLAFRRLHALDPHLPLVALLPGSRRREIEWILPEMLSAVKIFRESRSEVQFGIGLAGSRNPDKANELIGAALGADRESVKLIENDTYSLLNAADAAAVTSGTATLETALIGTPQVIVYKTSALSFGLVRPLLSIDTFGLANLVAGKKVFRELIQNDLTPKKLGAELERLLEPVTNEALRAEAAGISISMGESDASANAARAIVEFANWPNQD